jgi:amino-acid N-acetyltransferase
MTDAEPAIRPARADERDRIATLLDANGLPSRDVPDSSADFLVAVDGTDLLGSVGVEVDAPSGLLRSLVVQAPHRGEGLGGALVDAAEDHAAASGVETLYLLTTTAAAFFRRRGYEPVERENAPPAVKRTTEFAEQCPQSATCLHRCLD